MTLRASLQAGAKHGEGAEQLARRDEAAIYAGARVAALEREARRIVAEAEAIDLATTEELDRAIALTKQAAACYAQANGALAKVDR